MSQAALKFNGGGAGGGTAGLQQRAEAAEHRLRLAEANHRLRLVRAQGKLLSLGDYASAKRTRTRHGSRPRSTSADAQLDTATLESMRADGQRAYRNLSMARAVVNRAVQFAVGKGPRLQVKSSNPDFNKKAEAFFACWADRYCDVCNRRSLGQLLGEFLRCGVIDGDVGAVLTAGKGRAPEDLLRLQPVEGQRIGGTWQGFQSSSGTGKAAMVSGVELAPDGEHAAYWILDYTEQGTTEMGGRVGPGRAVGRRIDANDFVFLAMPGRLSQTRGEPRLCAAIQQIETLGRFNQATLIASEIAACQALVRKTGNPGATQGATLGDTVDRGDGSVEKHAEMQPGIIHDVNQGDEIATLKLEQPNTQYAEFIRMNVRLLGADLDQSIEALMLDFSQSTAYAGRTGFLVMAKAQELVRDRLRRSVMDPIARRVIGLGIAAGLLPFVSDFDTFKWQWPAPIMFEMDKEIAALAAGVNHNFFSKRWVVETYFSEDLEDVMEERSGERAAEKKWDIEPVAAPGTKSAGSTTESPSSQSGTEAGT